MQLLDELLRQGRPSPIDHQIDAAKVIGRLDDIVHIHRRIGNADGVRLKNIPGLIVGQAAALHMIGVVGQIDLHHMIDAAGQLRRLLLPQDAQ